MGLNLFPCPLPSFQPPLPPHSGPTPEEIAVRITDAPAQCRWGTPTRQWSVVSKVTELVVELLPELGFLTPRLVGASASCMILGESLNLCVPAFLSIERR